jgi:hypothetical protein
MILNIASVQATQTPAQLAHLQHEGDHQETFGTPPLPALWDLVCKQMWLGTSDSPGRWGL